MEFHGNLKQLKTLNFSAKNGQNDNPNGYLLYRWCQKSEFLINGMKFCFMSKITEIQRKYFGLISFAMNLEILMF